MSRRPATAAPCECAVSAGAGSNREESIVNKPKIVPAVVRLDAKPRKQARNQRLRQHRQIKGVA
jgi:hypothetical protein